MSACPCGGADFETCCGPRLSGVKPAETAEALMRSRYTAFSRGDANYLRASQLKPTRDQSWEETERWAKSVAWLSLQIVSKEAGTEADEKGVVEFIARYLEGAAVHALHERSTFSRQDGQWRYDSGAPEVTLTKVERNEPCPCGSGRKFKACHA
ncbi:MAG: YchJ family metal-binding protein [Archangium sp.]|nr:YchJ family metal-binding protein [Archangium sp.]MDP3156033.1 YchJ family metal-binding protein [Archangium sp.]MDP3572640.1 YchJ family metal-binding protein [Archangium sp.]